ncbi:sugar nucleotide-binding protein [Streptomyces sp. NPDC102381]|uniref:sugar nucleotide-binding protein n=1 Tax=Streptomyces sp. NPDC102381 TaxID=3366164 RepID=UPI0037F3FC29
MASEARQFVYLSTDRVFSGPGPHSSADAPAPADAYGEMKLSGERAVLAAAPASLVVRSSSLFNQAEEAGHSLGKLDSVDANDDVVFTPTYAPDLARVVVQAVSEGRRGTTHLVGPAVMSRYDFYQLASLCWGFDVKPTVGHAGLVSLVLAPDSIPESTARIRAVPEVFAPQRPPQVAPDAAATIYDCVGVVLGGRTWREPDAEFWHSQQDWEALTGQLAEAERVAGAYAPNPHFWRQLRRMPAGSPRVLANNGPLASFSIWEERYGFQRIFDVVINSEREGLTKPEPAFFSHLQSIFRGRPHRLIDDRESIVKAARGYSLDAVLSTCRTKWPVEVYEWPAFR